MKALLGLEKSGHWTDVWQVPSIPPSLFPPLILPNSLILALICEAHEWSGIQKLRARDIIEFMLRSDDKDLVVAALWTQDERVTWPIDAKGPVSQTSKGVNKGVTLQYQKRGNPPKWQLQRKAQTVKQVTFFTLSLSHSPFPSSSNHPPVRPPIAQLIRHG